MQSSCKVQEYRATRVARASLSGGSSVRFGHKMLVSMLPSAPQFIRHAPGLCSALLLSLVACGGTTGKSSEVPKLDAGNGSSGDSGQTPPPADAASDASDASSSKAHDTGTPAPAGDAAGAAPRNSSCTSTSQQTGTAVNTSYGRLDGKLVYVVGAGQDRQCNGDDSHVHLQLEVSGEVYDVAVDIGKAPNDEVAMYQESITVPDGTWSEGWHGSDSLVYPSIGVHSTSFVTADPGTIASRISLRSPTRAKSPSSARGTARATAATTCTARGRARVRKMGLL